MKSVGPVTTRQEPSVILGGMAGSVSVNMMCLRD